MWSIFALNDKGQLILKGNFGVFNSSKKWTWKFLKTLIFKVLYLLKMCPIFVGSVHNFGNTPDRTLFISGLKSRVMKLPFLSLKMMVKSSLEFILKLTEPLQICCCPLQKYLPRLAELAWQLSRYLWRGSVNFKINSRPLFTIIFELKNGNFMTRDFSPLIKRVLAGVANPALFILCQI